MKLFFISVYLLLLATADIAADPEQRILSSESNSVEDRPFKHTVLELRGRVRGTLALAIALEKPTENVVCSPEAALIPLGKLALGAEGQTLEEIVKAVGIRRITQFKEAFRNMIKDLQRLPGVNLHLASRVYVSSDVTLKETYLAEAKSIFQTGVTNMSFSDPKLIDSINKWVANETSQMITKIFSYGDVIASDAVAVANVIYFAGKWKYPFDSVQLGRFYPPNSGDNYHEATMMTRRGYFKYFNSEPLATHIIEVPYAGDEVSFIIVLPYARDGLYDVLEELVMLSPEALHNALQEMKVMRIGLSMPKFKWTKIIDLEHLYQHVGVTSIFKLPGLTRIAREKPVVVAAAAQKIVLEVNEYSVTNEKEKLKGSPDRDLIVKIEHPFLFIVKANKQILFSGIYNQP